jgi:hypothetical protein
MLKKVSVKRNIDKAITIKNTLGSTWYGTGLSIVSSLTGVLACDRMVLERPNIIKIMGCYSWGLTDGISGSAATHLLDSSQC